MKTAFVCSALTAATIAGAVQAAEITGGYIDLGYSTFTDSNLGDVYNLNGSGEVAFSKSFSTQLDLGGYRFQDEDLDGNGFTLHANLHTGNSASFGAFYGRDNLEHEDFQFYGLEAGFDAGTVEIEGYIGRQDLKGVSDADGTVLGIAVFSDINDKWELNAKYDLLDNVEGLLDVNTFSVGTAYNLTEQAEVYGELGTAHMSVGNASTNEAFVGVGVRMNFGKSRGTTFGRRGVLTKLPGL